MPKQAPPMATDKEMDDWLKERGYDFSKGVPEQPTTTPSGSAEAGASPTESGEPGTITSGFRGAAKSVAQPLAGAARLAGRGMEAVGSMLPEPYASRSREFVERDLSDPQFQAIEKFGNEPWQNVAEGVGGVAGTVGAGLLTPELGLANYARAAVPATRAVTTMTWVPGGATWVNPLGQGGRWMQQAGRFVRGTRAVPDPRLLRAAGLGGETLENLSKGAVGGALGDPEDPGKGALYGAAGGAAPAGLAAGLRSRFGTGLGDALFRYLPASVAAALVTGVFHGVGSGAEAGIISHGAQHGLRHLTRGQIGWHGTPVGNALGRAGRAAFDNAGKFIGYVDPVSGGMLTGQAVRGRDPRDIDFRDVYERTKEAVNPTVYPNPPPGEDGGEGEPRPPASE